MKIKNLLVLSILIFAMACSDPDPIPVALDKICYDEYKEKIIVTEGNLYLPGQMKTYGARMHMGIRDQKTNVRVPTLKILSLNDATENCMKTLPEQYTVEDVKVYDHAGKIVPLGSRIRVTGTLRGASQSYCELWVDKIEKIN